MQQEILIAKSKGLEETRKVINQWNHNKEFKYELMAVSNVTANKLLQGEFQTFEELKKETRSDFEDTGFNSVEILFREIYNESREDYIYIIETIFINE